MESESSNLYSSQSKENPYVAYDERNPRLNNDSGKNHSNSCSPAVSIRNRKPSKPQKEVNKIVTKEIIKNEFVFFCQNTSIRGVGRIVKSTQTKLFALWLGSFILLCICLLMAMFFLCRQYLAYDVIHPPRVLDNEASPFPSLTICNLRPLSPSVRSFLASKNFRNPREFANNLNAYAKNHYLNRNLRNKYAATTAILSMGGYLESIPNISYFKELGHSLEDMAISCMVNYMDGSKPLLDDCKTIGKWKTIYHPQYINCYSFVLNNAFSYITNSIEFFVYLAEEVNTTQCIDCFVINVKTQLSGAVLVIHNPASYPDINQESINLMPGTLTEIKLKTIQNKMKTPPYGKCNKSTPEFLRIDYGSYNYSEMACKFVTLQRLINEKCNCSTLEFPFIDNNTLPFCTSLRNFISHSSCPLIDWKNTNASVDKNCTDEIELALDRLACKNNIVSQYHGDGMKGCHLPCSFYSYETDRSTSSWPTKSYQLHWIQTNIARHIIGKPELQNYKKAIQLLAEGNEAEAYEILMNQNVLEKRLVGVIISKPNYKLHVVEEKEVLSLTSLLSQSGGLFSMFIGLTFINIVEMIEMFIRLSDIIEKRKLEENETFDNIEAKIHPMTPDKKNITNEPSNCYDIPLDSLTASNSPREVVI